MEITQQEVEFEIQSKFHKKISFCVYLSHSFEIKIIGFTFPARLIYRMQHKYLSKMVCRWDFAGANVDVFILYYYFFFLYVTTPSLYLASHVTRHPANLVYRVL